MKEYILSLNFIQLVLSHNFTIKLLSSIKEWKEDFEWALEQQEKKNKK